MLVVAAVYLNILQALDKCVSTGKPGPLSMCSTLIRLSLRRNVAATLKTLMTNRRKMEHYTLKHNRRVHHRSPERKKDVLGNVVIRGMPHIIVLTEECVPVESSRRESTRDSKPAIVTF